MPAALVPIEDLGDTPRERRTLRKVGIAVALVIAGVAGAASVIGWAYAQTEPLAQRVTTLEAHRQNDKDRAQRIEDKVDFLIERLVR